MVPSASHSLLLDIAAAELADLVKAHGIYGLGSIRPIKTSAQSDVFKADLHGAPVILKRYKGQGATKAVTAALAEMAAVQGHMSAGPLQAMRSCESWGQAGLVALAHVPGTHLNTCLARADRAERDRIFGHAGRWAAHYTRGRTVTGRLAPRFWIKKTRELETGPLRNEMAEKFQAGLEGMRQLTSELAGAALPVGAVHGDLIGPNLLLANDCLTGVDINGMCQRPLAWEAAHFLIWQALRPPYLRDRHAFLDRMRLDHRGFFEGHGLIGEDRVFTFFALYQLCLRMVAYSQKEERAQPLCWALEAMLDRIQS